MQTLDYIVLVTYFAVMIVVGILCAWRIKAQEDFFMGGRSFGKLLQTFAAFGAGTGANDPIQTGRTTWTSGMSGIWSVLMWLFVTPFYWIFGVWYRRMRLLTLGDWFVERYESRAMGVAYTVFAFTFCIMYLSSMFSAISKVAAPLIGPAALEALGLSDPEQLKFYLLPTIAVVVIIYGILGGLTAAYWTDLIQGMCIIVLSVILIPTGLWELVKAHGDPATMTMMDGFRIMHERLPEDYFKLFSGPHSGEFPVHYIISLTLLGLVGIVVQPHFIATGGGSAKSENAARIGLVSGNFLKRFCTIGWALTGLIVLALLADDAIANQDPDYAWGAATLRILGPLKLGLVGLMLACLLAALMSSADCYMLITSALVVRNIYAPYFDPNASEKKYVNIGRSASFIVILGAMLVSLYFYNVFQQFKLAIEVTIVFAAPFWIGMFWRRANRWSAWLTIAFSAIAFFMIPIVSPWVISGLRTNPQFTATNQIVVTTITRKAAASDKDQRNAAIKTWEQANAIVEAAWAEFMVASSELSAATPATSEGSSPVMPPLAALKIHHAALNDVVVARTALEKLGPKPLPLNVGEPFEEKFTSGGKAIFWSEGVRPVDEQGNLLTDVKPRPLGEPRKIDDATTQMVLQYDRDVRLQGFGNFNLDFLLYQSLGMDLKSANNALLETLRLPPRLITPFLFMILVSLVTPRNGKEALDRYYVKMKTPVDPDREEDRRQMELSYEDPARFDGKKLLPGTELEFQKPTSTDVWGFLISVGICVLFIGLAAWVASIGS
jgi:SSS family solute:Na+ symporter